VGPSGVGSWSIRGGNHRVHGAEHQAVALELAQREHALADAVDAVAELGEAAALVGQQRDDQQRPLVGHPVEDLAHLAVVFGRRRWSGCRPGRAGR
jgi:hypothetical protein